MRTGYLILLGLIFSLLASNTYAKNTILLEKKPRWLPHFNAISVQGDIDVEVVGSTHKHIGSIPHVVKPVYSIVRDKTLYLCNTPTCNTEHLKIWPGYTKLKHDRSVVIIHTDTLDRLLYRGRGDITALNIRSDGLQVDIDTPGNTVIKGNKMALRDLKTKGTGQIKISGVSTRALNVEIAERTRVELSGVSSLENLNFSGRGNLYMYWLHSCRLHVNGKGRAQAFLAGIADTVDIKLTDRAYLNAKHLHAEDVYVRSNFKARADVWARRNLSAMAGGTSSIFYHHVPETLYDYLKSSGAVLPASDTTVFEPHDHYHGVVRSDVCTLPPIELS